MYSEDLAFTDADIEMAEATAVANRLHGRLSPNAQLTDDQFDAAVHAGATAAWYGHGVVDAIVSYLEDEGLSVESRVFDNIADQAATMWRIWEAREAKS